MSDNANKFQGIQRTHIIQRIIKNSNNSMEFRETPRNSEYKGI